MRSILSGWFFVAVLLLGLSTPAFLVYVVDRKSEVPPALEPPHSPVFAGRNAVDVREQRDGTAVLEMPLGQVVTSTAASGLVTGLPQKPGAILADGTAVMQLNGYTIYALVWPFPLYRTITSTSEGFDVAALQKLLATLGLFSGPADGRSSADLRKAIRAFEVSVGRVPTGTFGPDYVLWVGSNPVTLDRYTIKIGDRLDSGSKVLQEKADAPRIVVNPSVGSPVDLLNGYQAFVQDRLVGTVENGAVSNPVGIDALRDAGDILKSDDPSLERVQLKLRLVGPTTQAEVVPSSALIPSKTDPQIACMWLGDMISNLRMVRVQLLKTSASPGPGAVYIAPIEPSGSVLVNPVESLADLRCS